MAKMNFGGVIENVITREEFPLSKALETLKDETIAVIGYGVQGPGQSLNLRDNGFNVIVGQRKGSKSWDKAVADGWVPGETLFEIEEAAERATIIQYLLSDAGQIAVWPSIKKHLTPGKALYFSHGFGITYKERTGIVPPADVDVILIAPKGSGTSLRRMFLQGRGLNSSYAVFQDATGRAFERVVALGIGVVLALAVCLFLKAKMKSVRQGAEADAYVTDEGLNLTEQYDNYTHTTKTSRKISKDSDSDSSSHSGGGGSGSSGKY